MASSSPPPLVPIHGPDRIHRTIVKQSGGNQEMESQFGASFNGGHCGVKEEITVKEPYNQPYNKDSFLRNEDLTTQSHMKIEGLGLRTLKTSSQEESGVPHSEFPTNSLCHNFNQSQGNNLQEKRTLDGPKMVADTDCYWYRKNIKNVETINRLKNEVQRLRKKLVAVERIGAVASQFSPVELTKKNDNFQDTFKCKHCQRLYKTERGLQFHLARHHTKNQTHYEFMNTMPAVRPDVQSKQSGNNRRFYNNNGLHMMSPQASLILFPDVLHPSVSSP